jgi:hypothetical protein
MRTLVILALASVLAGCGGGRMPEIEAEVEATALANVRTVNVFTLSLPGETGRMFNDLLETKLKEKLAGHLNPGSRWTLTVVNVEYTTPHFKQETPCYRLALEAEMVDMHGKRGWHAKKVETPEIPAGPDWSEQEVREQLVDAVVDALVSRLPLGRLDVEEE